MAYRKYLEEKYKGVIVTYEKSGDLFRAKAFTNKVIFTDERLHIINCQKEIQKSIDEFLVTKPETYEDILKFIKAQHPETKRIYL